MLAAFLVLIAVSAYTTLNRTIWIAFALQLALIAALQLRRFAARIASPNHLAAALAAAAVFVLAIALVVKVQGERGLSDPGRALAEDPRFSVWPVALERIAAKPLTGYGFGRGIERQTLRGEAGQAVLWHSHNLFVEAALQTGVPGALLLLALFAALVREGWRAARAPDPARAACGMALLALLAGTLMRNMTDVLLVRQNALLFWGLAGLLLGLAAVRTREAAP
jgi:O-antigen ligase